MNQSEPRKAEKSRVTNETSIKLDINLDGSGQTRIKTGFGMLDHLLTLLAFWAGFDLNLECNGDLDVDAHHTTEDAGLVLGTAFLEALGNRQGIARVGYGRVPMDEALAEATVDISGRPWLEWRGDELLPPVIAREEKDLWREFYKAFTAAARINLHINFLYGKNGHHLLESATKSAGIALGAASRRLGKTIRSTKGGLD